MSIWDHLGAVNPRNLFVALLSLGVAACGGGGGGSPPPPPPPPPPPLALSLSTNAVTFSTVAPHTAAPAGVNVTATVTGTGTGTLFVVVSTDNPAVATVSNIVLGAGNSGQGTIVPGSPGTLQKRAHTATITVRACVNDATCQTGQIAGSPRTVSVTYNVAGIDTSTATLDFNIANAPTAADLARTFNVTGHLIPTWNATTNAPWLSLAPPSGNTTAPTTVTASLIQSAIDALENGTYSGTITLTPSEGVPRSIAVNLTLQRTRVNYVAPYVARANVADQVIIRGENFTQFAPTSVEFGPGNVASSFIRDSNTQIRATHPALPAGSYAVRVINNGVVANTRAQLVVVDATAYTQQTLQYPGGSGVFVTSLTYDAERRALLVGLERAGVASIARFAFAGVWNSQPEMAVPSTTIGSYTSTAALSTDGRALFLAYNDTAVRQFTLAELDPVTLTQTKFARFVNESEGYAMAVSNNGRAIIKTGMSCCGGGGNNPIVSYDPLAPSASAITLLQNPFATLNSTGIGGSGDGSRILVPTDDSSSPNPMPLLRYNSDLGTLVNTTGDIESPTGPRVVLNRRGTHMLVRVVNSGQIQLIGTTLPYTVVGTLAAGTADAAFSPTAEVIFGYDNTETLTAYDMTGTVLAAGLTITGTGSGGLVTVSPDGGTVFVAGDQELAVVPADDIPQ